MYWHVYICMYRLKYMYQCFRTNPTLISKECKTKCILRAKYMYRSMTVSTYKYMLVLVYLCVYVRLEYMYRCRINPNVLGKECKNKCILRAKNVYHCMTVSAYKYMLVLVYLCLYVSASKYVSVYKNQPYCNRQRK
jgi:hypothetical protein